MKRILLCFCMGCITLPALQAQVALTPSQSPMATVAMRYESSYLKIVYSRPDKKGREIFGKVVPFGQVWQLGANEATEMTLTGDILINQVRLNAGTYSLFAIPEKNEWTIIINKDLGLWGSYNYNAKSDVFRIIAPVVPIPDVVYEPFTIRLDQRNSDANMVILWDKTSVSIPIHFLEPGQ